MSFFQPPMMLMSQFNLQIGCNECIREYMNNVLSDFYIPMVYTKQVKTVKWSALNVNPNVMTL